MTNNPAEPGAPEKPSGNDVEDLFKESEDKAPATEKEMPTEPAEKAEDKTEKKDDVEDLFKSSSRVKARRSVARRPAPTMTSELENLFAEPPVASESAAAMRLWTDNTGKFQIKAQLVTIGKNHVRLLKETGKYTTVTFDRLSRADLVFVRSISTGTIASNN
ncbi:MAG TPA: SHD1 domain-containing protein [Pirellulales bacterium]|nr:SHD1 domain-containing protein [Pirellulales bacterium]